MKCPLSLFFVLVFGSAVAQVTMSTNSNYAPSNPTSSFSYTPASTGSNRVVVFFIACEFNATTDDISGISWGGVSGTLISTSTITGSGRRDRVSAYRFIESQMSSRSSDAATVSFSGTVNTSDGMGVSAYTLVNVNQTTPFEDAQTFANASASTASTSNINADTDDRVIYLAVSSGSTSTWTAGGSFTENNDIQVSGQLSYTIGSDLRTNNGVSSPSATNSGTNRLAMIAFETNYTSPTLPVELVDFNAEKVENGNLLSWHTASEQNSQYFKVERSGDGLNFTEIGSVNAAGNSMAMLSYTYTDYTPLKGANYYRLRQMDIGGPFTYSDVRLLFNDASEIAVSNVWPNPSSSDFTFEVFSPRSGTLQLELFDNKGAVVYSETQAISGGGQNILFSGEKISTGIYTMKLSLNGVFMKTCRLVKL